MIKKLEEITGEVYVPSPGSIYPTLQLLEDQGYVTVEERKGKKLYCIMDAGRNYLKENQKEQSFFISSEFEPFVRHQDFQQIHLEAAELSRPVCLSPIKCCVVQMMKKTRNFFTS